MATFTDKMEAHPSLVAGSRCAICGTTGPDVYILSFAGVHDGKDYLGGYHVHPDCLRGLLARAWGELPGTLQNEIIDELVKAVKGK